MIGKPALLIAGILILLALLTMRQQEYTLVTTTNTEMAKIQRRGLPGSFIVDFRGRVFSTANANVEFTSPTEMTVNGKRMVATTPARHTYRSLPPHVSGYSFSYTRRSKIGSLV